jgi:hypothetical protein
MVDPAVAWAGPLGSKLDLVSVYNGVRLKRSVTDAIKGLILHYASDFDINWIFIGVDYPKDFDLNHLMVGWPEGFNAGRCSRAIRRLIGWRENSEDDLVAIALTVFIHSLYLDRIGVLASGSGDT